MAIPFPVPLPAEIFPEEDPDRRAVAILAILEAPGDGPGPDHVLVAHADGWLDWEPLHRVRLVVSAAVHEAIRTAALALRDGAGDR